MNWTIFFLAVASLTSLVWWLPQLVKLWRQPSTAVSPATWTLSALNTALWTVWAITVDQPVVAVVEGVQTLGAAAIAIRAGATVQLVLVAAVSMGTLFAASAWKPLAAIAAILTAGLVRLPQWRSLTRWGKLASAGEVSVATWLMAIVTNLFWLAWAILSDHPAMIFGAGTAALTSAAVMAAAKRSNAGLKQS